MEGERLRGNLEDLHFPELLFKISSTRQTGLLHVVRNRIEKDIYFQDGRAVFAKSNDPDQRLGELLLRQGKVSFAQLEASARKIQPGMRLGTILVQDGYLKASDLYQAVIDQVEEIIYSLFERSEGEYEFTPGDLPSKEVITLSISTPDVILAGISRIWRWSWVSKAVGGLHTVYVKKPDSGPTIRKMSITPILHATLSMLEQPITLEEILSRSRVNNFETCRLLWSFLTIGIIEEVKPAQAEAPDHLLKPEVTTDIFAASRYQEEKQPVAVAAAQPPPEPATQQEAAVLPVMHLENGETAAPDLSFSDLADLTDAAAEQPEAPSPQPSPDNWDRDLAADILRFNEIHRYIFEVLRMEVGKGVSNFLSKIVKKASARYPLVFEGARMTEFGEFEAQELEASIRGNLAENYPEAFQFLIQEEKVTMTSFLDKKRMESIEAGMTRIAERQKASPR